MRTILIALAALALSACQVFQGNPLVAKSTPFIDSYAVATLEPLGSCGWQIAPEVTANAVERRRSAKLTNDGKLSAADLQRVIALHDASRAALERACADGQAKAPSATAVEISRTARAQARAIMERAR